MTISRRLGSTAEISNINNRSKVISVRNRSNEGTGFITLSDGMIMCSRGWSTRVKHLPRDILSEIEVIQTALIWSAGADYITISPNQKNTIRKMLKGMLR
jgi:hypothetical protein